MTLLDETLVLLKKDLLLEWRQKHAFNGIILYGACTVFICYMSLGIRGGSLSVSTWNALFWIIMLFIAVNAIAKSFMQESRGRNLYYYTVSSSTAVIFSKLVYNILLMSLFSGVTLVFYMVVLGNPVDDLPFFLLAVFLGVTGLAVTLTLISAMASKAGGNATLMAVLGFPVAIPVLVMTIKISKNAIDGLARNVSTDEIVILMSVNVLLTTLSFLLFPYLWRS